MYQPAIHGFRRDDNFDYADYEAWTEDEDMETSDEESQAQERIENTVRIDY